MPQSRHIDVRSVCVNAMAAQWKAKFTLCRRQQEGLQSVVWSWSGLRAAKHAPICSLLLSASYCSSVSRWHIFPPASLTPRPQPIRCAPVAGPGVLLRRNRAVREPSFARSKTCAHTVRDRTRDAVECLKRALLGADARETAINLKLAKLYEELDEPVEAVAYHRRVVEICCAEGA